MEKSEALSICQERLSRWADKLAGEVATPVLLLGVKHGEGAGGLVLCITEDVRKDDLRALLIGALQALPANGSHV
jgi:hypothetical protein